MYETSDCRQARGCGNERDEPQTCRRQKDEQEGKGRENIVEEERGCRLRSNDFLHFLQQRDLPGSRNSLLILHLKNIHSSIQLRSFRWCQQCSFGPTFYWFTNAVG